MEIKGTIEKILPMVEGVSKSSGQPWQSREIIIRLNEGVAEYPRRILVKGFTKHMAAISMLREGMAVRAQVDFGVREYNGRYYMDASLYTIEQEGAQQAPQPMAQPAPQPAPQFAPQPLPPQSGMEALPF